MNKVESDRNEVKSAVITGLKWLASARLIAQVSSWAVTLVVIRLLTPSDYGLQAMVAVIYGLLLLVSQSGLDRAIARHEQLSDAYIRQLLGFYLALSLTMTAGIWLIAPWVADYYQEPRVVLLLRVLAIGFVINVFKSIPIGIVWRNLDYRTHALASLVGTLTGGAVTLLMAILGYGVWALIIGMLVVPGATAIYLQLKTHWLVLPTLSLTGIKPILKYAWTISAGFFIWQFAWGLDILLGGKQIPAAELGFYAVAIHLCALPLSKVVPLANEILYPAYARLQSDPSAIDKYFQKSLVSLCFVLFPAFLGLAAISQWLVPVLFGANWAGIERIMMIVAMAMPFRVLLSMCNPVLNATGSAKLSLWSGVFAAVFIAIAVWTSLRWGVTGLALAALVVSPVVMLVVVLQLKKTSGISLRKMATTSSSLFIISTIMAVLVFLLGAWLDSHISNIWVIVAQVFSGVLLYVALAIIFAKAHFRATINIVKSSFGSRSVRQTQ